MSDENHRCQFAYHDLHDASSPVRAFFIRLVFFSLKKHIQEGENILSLSRTIANYFKTGAFSLLHKQDSNAKTKKTRRPYVALHLQPGELVEVLSEDEIHYTLDDKGRLRGLEFIPEMRKFCGKQFRVYKRLEDIILETTGEIRKIKNTVLLEGAICDGSEHFGCDRSCFCFWREAWLKRVPSETTARKS